MANRSSWRIAERIDAEAGPRPEGTAAAPPPPSGPPASAEPSAADASQLLDLLLAEQNGQLGPQQQPRRGVRVRRALPVELAWDGEVLRGCTLDLGTGGFAVLLACAPPRDARVVAIVRLSRKEQVSCEVRVVSARERRGSLRVSFAFARLEPEARERIEAALLDDAVAELKMTPAPPR